MKNIQFEQGQSVKHNKSYAHKIYGNGVVIDPCVKTDMLWGINPNLIPVEFYVSVKHSNNEVCLWHGDNLEIIKG